MTSSLGTLNKYPTVPLNKKKVGSMMLMVTNRLKL